MLNVISEKTVNYFIGDNPKLVAKWARDTLEIHANGGTVLPKKTYLNLGKAPAGTVDYERVIYLPGAITEEPYTAVGAKMIGSSKGNYALGLQRANAVVLLHDPITKLPAANVSATQISTMRTFAYTQMLFDAALQPDARVGVIGMGPLGKMHARFLGGLYPDHIRTIYVHSDNAPFEDCLKFPKVSKATGGVEQILQECDVIVTTTSKPGAYIHEVPPHVRLINCLSGVDFGSNVIQQATSVVVDDPDIILGSGKPYVADLFDAQARIGLTRLHALTPAMIRPQSTTYMNTIGLGILDVSIAEQIRRLVKEQGLSGSAKRFFWNMGMKVIAKLV